MRTLTLAIGLFAGLLISAPNISHSQDTDSQNAAIELIKESRAFEAVDEILRATMAQLAEKLREKYPSMPDQTVDVIIDEAMKGLNNKKPLFHYEVAKLYTRYFTADEMRAITKFYRTPVGQKSISVLPQLTIDAMRIGNNWAQAALPEVLAGVKKRLKKQGYEL